MKAVKRARPLPTNRTKVTMMDEVDAEKGKLTQTQILSLEEKDVQPGNSKKLAADFHVGEADVVVLLKYYRAPEIRLNLNQEKEARWNW
ncbi:unnamed protein product, partial [Choristocarpus tenellus]